MSYFTHEQVTPVLTRIRDVSGVCMYLVKGSEKAVLIDTGVGFGDLYSYVMNLTEQEPAVIITHGHVDHAMGAGSFREVYISPADRDVYRTHSSLPMRQDYVASSGISGGNPEAIQGADPDQWKEPLPWEQFRSLQVGDVFDLGDLHLEICPGAGHTPGCVTVLFREEKILFLGDAANDFTFLFGLGDSAHCLSLKEYAAELSRLEEQTDGKYDRCMFFHGPGEGSIHMVSGVKALVAEILEGKDDGLPFMAMGRNDLRLAKAIDFSKMSRADGGTGNLVYDPALK